MFKIYHNECGAMLFVFYVNRCMLDAKLHSMSGHIFHKQVSRPIHLSENESSGQDSKKSLLLSENEKMQGLQTKYGNPLIAMTAKFLEPVMRCLEVYLSIVRAGFSVATWKDPYMSFWILIGLIFLMIFLIVFPWKLFFLIIGIVSFGPQVSRWAYIDLNYVLRTSSVSQLCY